MAEETTGELEIVEMELDEENLARLISNDEQSRQQFEQSPPMPRLELDSENLQDHEDMQEDVQMMQDGEQCEHDNGDEENLDTISAVVGPRLFVSGLNSGITDAEFREYFEKYGKLANCSVARKRRDVEKKGKTRGFGFVTMATMAGNEAVLKDTHVIQDRVVTVLVSRPADAPERKLCLCIKNLDIEKTTVTTLAAHFSQFGTINNCTITKHQVDGKVVSRGLGYVSMTTEEEVQAVLKGCINGHQTIDEKVVDVKRVVGNTQKSDRLRKLWFGGLDRDKTTEWDLAYYFSYFGMVTDCIIVRDPPETDGEECKSKGYGFIKMASVEETDAILKHTRPHKIHDKTLVFNRLPLHPSQNGYDAKRVKEIYVSGLKDGTLTSGDLRTYFKTHANVRTITMMKEEGAARVLLCSADEAEKLAHMGDHFVNNFWLRVKIADPQVPVIQSDKSKKQPAKQKQSSNKKGSGNQPNAVKGSSGTGKGAGQKTKIFRGRGSALQGSSRQPHGSRQLTRGFGSLGGRGQYRNQPMPGGYAPSFQSGMADYYYEKDPSGYGPVRGRGVAPTMPRSRVQGRGRASGGSWQFVENSYRDPEPLANQRHFPLRGFIGKGRGSILSMGVGCGDGESPAGGRFNDADGLGGGYDDEWREGGNVMRGRGRGWRPY